MLYRVARWLLTRLLFVLLVALAVVVFARQFSDGHMAKPSPEVTRPAIGDHWHIAYKVYICGQRQPDFAFWQGGILTHDDGIIHLHPLLPSEEGEGARLVKWFVY